MDFKNRVVLVTGSSRGIGKEIALSFAKQGAIVIVNGNKDYNSLERTYAEVKKYSKKSLMIQCDVSNYDSVNAMMSKIIDTFGKIDILINNAGISNYDLITELSAESWNDVIRTNLNSVFYCSKFALRNMIHNKDGVIINISSIWGDIGASCEVAYATSKGGINAFTKSLAMEVGPSNIRVNAIACGFIDTTMNAMFNKKEVDDFISTHSILNRIGHVSDISNLALFLASDKASYITGQIINSDGGYY